MRYFWQSNCPCWHTLHRSEILSPQLILHLSSDSSEVLYTSTLWYKDVHMVLEFGYYYLCWSYCPCWLRLCPYHSLNVHDWIDLILCRMFCYDLKMGIHLRFLRVILLTILWPFIRFGSFYLLNHLTKGPDFCYTTCITSLIWWSLWSW